MRTDEWRGGTGAVRQNRVCNGSFLLVLDILSIQGIILRALLYTMHSVDGTFNHLTSQLPSNFSPFSRCFSFSRGIPQYHSMMLDDLQATAFPGNPREGRWSPSQTC